MKRKDFLKASGIIAFSPLLLSNALLSSVKENKFDITMRIHHFFDIICTLSKKKELSQSITKHSYHTVTHAIRDNALLRMKIVLGVDSVCEGCIHNVNNKCISGTKVEGYSNLNDFNDDLDNRILDKCRIENGQIITPREVCELSGSYIDNLEYIYAIHSTEDLLRRRKEFTGGLQYYSRNHNFSLGFLDD